MATNSPALQQMIADLKDALIAAVVVKHGACDKRTIELVVTKEEYKDACNREVIVDIDDATGGYIIKVSDY